MTRLLSERDVAGPAPRTSGAAAGPGIFGSAALLLALTGCANTGVQGQFFDYQPAAAQSTESISAKARPQGEQPKVRSASGLLGNSRTGPGYTVRASISSDGRYNSYVFETERGTYSVTGDTLARKHIQELAALEALKQYSPTAEFMHGAGDAVISPVKGVFTTVTNPVGAAKATYTNVGRRLKSVQRGVSQAGEFVTTLGKPEKKRPSREDENLLEKFIDRPKMKRRLAQALGVDPYTHFVPLSNELTKMASYSAAGTFSVDRALSFVPGAAGTVISGIGTLNSFTAQTIDMAPDDIAAVNRERLEKLNIPEPIIKKFLLSDKLTPTEKTLSVGYLVNLSGTAGLESLAAFVAESDTRHDAFAALQTLSYLSAQPFGSGSITNAEIIHGIPVLTLVDAKKVAFFSSDHLSWTSANSSTISSLSAALRSNGRRAPKREMCVSGSISDLAKRQIQRQGWVVKTNIFNLPHAPI